VDFKGEDAASREVKPLKQPKSPKASGEKAQGTEITKPVEVQPPPSPSPQPEGRPSALTLDAFRQVDLRVGTVKHAEPVPKSKKLLRLIVDIGEDRQVVAGIAQSHTPEELLGKQVVVVANLQPARLMGIESHGMVLAVRDGETLRLLAPEAPVAPGGRVS
jgi:methionyl-tRNA synthetase